MKAAWIAVKMSAVAVSALLLAGTAQANEALAKEKGCMNCHAIDKKMVGPGFKDIAAKYKGDKGAEAALSEKVKKGSSGVWGMVPMPANAAVSDGDIKTLMKWVLATK